MTVGILMLDTRFPRYLGEIGNPPPAYLPVLHEVVRGASVGKVVQAKTPPMLEDFVAAGERLIARGATCITTGCGFLVLNQAALAARLAVPVATSALLLVPTLMQLLSKDRRVGVLTFSAADLRPAHLEAAGAPLDIPIEGVEEGGVFQRAIYEQPCADSLAAREADVVAAARRLVARHPEVGALLFECTNFPPHRAAVEAATGLPVYDIWSLVTLLRGQGHVTLPEPETRSSIPVAV